jgi:hypothetical protein
MIDKAFAYHRPSQEGLESITRLRAEFTDLARTIEAVCPKSRQKAVALTELETAAMWAIKSVVSNDPLSVVED